MELSLFFLFIYRILVPVFLVLPYYMVNKDEYKSALKTGTPYSTAKLVQDCAAMSATAEFLLQTDTRDSFCRLYTIS